MGTLLALRCRVAQNLLASAKHLDLSDPPPRGLRTFVARVVPMALLKRTLYPVDTVVQGWADVQAIIAWAKAKPEDVRGLAQALGEEEVDAEPLAALPDEMIMEAFSTWVVEKSQGRLPR